MADPKQSFPATVTAAGTDALPFVSVIIPVYNDAVRLRRCLQALAEQDYPPERREVIVADNGSDQDLAALVGSFSGVQLCHEARPGSYAARNRALEQAQGDVLAFTDSDCLPQADWLSTGVAWLARNRGCGLVAGKIALFFEHPARPTAVELFESVTAFPQHKYVQKYHYGATANLFTWRSVMAKIGPFNPALTSGGDREWGQRVHAAGYPLLYADDLVVQHPARRSFAEMYRKVARVTGGLEDLRMRRSYPLPALAKAVAKDLLPPRKDLAEIWRDPRLRGLGQRFRVAGVLLGLRYAQAWVRVRSRLGGARVR